MADNGWLQDLLGKVSKEDQVKLKILHNAVLQTMKAYRDDPTTVRRRDWETAEKALADQRERLEAQLAEAAADQQEWPDSFPSLRAVEAYLRAQGYQVSKSTVANHVKEGLLRRRKGKFPRKSVERYAEVNLARAESGLVSGEERNVKLQERKLKAEIRLKEEQARKAIMENEILEGKYILRADHERNIAAACGVLESGLKYFFRLKSQEIIDLVGGDQAHAPRLYQYLCEQLDVELNKFARAGEVEVEVKG